MITQKHIALTNSLHQNIFLSTCEIYGDYMINWLIPLGDLLTVKAMQHQIEIQDKDTMP